MFRYRGSRESLEKRTYTAKKLKHGASYFDISNLDDVGILGSLKQEFQRMEPIKKMSCIKSWLFCRSNYR